MPDRAQAQYVLKEIPIAWHIKHGCGGEVVFGVVRPATYIRVRVLSVPAIANFAISVVQLARRRRVDKVVPWTVQRGRAPAINSDKKSA